MTEIEVVCEIYEERITPHPFGVCIRHMDTMDLTPVAFIRTRVLKLTQERLATALGRSQPSIDTTLDNEVDAGDLAEILVEMLSRATQRYRVPLRTLSLRYWLGDRVRLTYDRFGLDDGRDYLVTGIDEASDGNRSLVLLGEPPTHRYST